MKKQNILSWGIVFLFFLSLSLSLFAQAPTPEQKSADVLHNNRYSGKDWTQQSIAREAFARHKLHRQRLAQAGRAEAAEAAVTDVNDISVVQDDGSIIVPANLFDLAGKIVTFTPSGTGYQITSGTATYDTNLGTKLDLTQAPAVNPKIPGNPDVEPGDDAYITQDLGFAFNFFGATYSNVAISSNGNVTFRPVSISDTSFANSTVDSGESIVTLQGTLPRIAPYWHDLDARASVTTGSNGIYIRKAADRVLISWNFIRDFPNPPNFPNGLHRFQVTLFQDGRITFVYESAQLTSTALAGISGGNSNLSPTVIDFANPPATANNSPIAELFANAPSLDELSAIKAFYTAHPGQDVYDFAYIFLDFDYSLGSNAFAFYQPIRSNIAGIGSEIVDYDELGSIGGKKILGLLQLSTLSTQYPEFPTTRFLGANNALSIFGQEQGHCWLAYVGFPGATPEILLGRDFEHWSFYFNTESTLSHPAARRSSSSEGNVWRDNNNGTFTSVSLVDGYSRMDQYLMGLRPASQVPEMFNVARTTTPTSRSANPRPNVTTTGTKQIVTVDQFIQFNGARVPDASTATKDFRAAVIVITQKGQQATQATLNKVFRYRLAWESYFAQSTDYLATINTGLTPQTGQKVVAVANGANYSNVVAPGAICSLFGKGLTSGNALVATPGQPLPFNLAGVEIKVDGTPAPLFYAGPLQVNFQMPRTVAATTNSINFGTVNSATATVEVFQNGQLIRACAVQLAPNVTGTFSLSQDGAGPAAALDAITFTPAPFNAKQTNGQANFIAMYTTGLGADVTDVDGNVNASVQVLFNGNPVTVQYAGRAPGFTGLNQINFQLPANVTAGTYSIVIVRDGIQSNATTIAVK